MLLPSCVSSVLAQKMQQHKVVVLSINRERETSFLVGEKWGKASLCARGWDTTLKAASSSSRAVSLN